VAYHGALPASGALLGIDLGSKTIGLAVSDPTRIIASPLETAPRGRLHDDIDRLSYILEARSIVALVLGLPRNMDGSDGTRVQATRAFARNIAGALGVPILLWDERLTTATVQRMLIDADQSRKRRAEVVDKLAATVILQSALERFRHLPVPIDR
jgi:putative Holliday junction resolvase